MASEINQKYLETIKKNWSLDIVPEDGFRAIKIIANRAGIDPYKELASLNRLFDKCKISDNCFQCFVFKEIISIKKILRFNFYF